MSNVTALVTGASGFLGTALRHALVASGNLPISIQAGTRDVAAPVRCKMLYRGLIAALQRHRVDVLFHLAGAGIPYVDRLGSRYHFWANVGTTRAVVDAIEAAGFRGRVVFSSSASVYGNSGIQMVTEDFPLRPCSEYGCAKTQAEACLLDRIGQQCDLWIARIFHVFGPGQRKLVVYDLATRLVAGNQPLVVRGTGQEVRDFIFVDDAIRALIFLGVDLPRASTPQIINVCSGVPTMIGDLARFLLRHYHRSEDELRFIPRAASNPVDACVGDPKRLESLGVKLQPSLERHLVDTLSWIWRGGLS